MEIILGLLLKERREVKEILSNIFGFKAVKVEVEKEKTAGEYVYRREEAK